MKTITKTKGIKMRMILFLLAILNMTSAFSKVEKVASSSKFNDFHSTFIENKGQINGNTVYKDAKFVYFKNGFTFILNSNGFSYGNLTASNQTLTSIVFKNGLKYPEMKASLPNLEKIIYVKNNKTGGTENVVTNTYNKVVYANVYKNIDVEFKIDKNSNIEYDFIIHPGGNIDDISLEYENLQSIEKLDSKNIHIKITNGFVNENIPSSYVKETNEKISINYELSGKTLSFKPSNPLEKGKTIIIDPTLQWTSYSIDSDSYTSNVFSIISDKNHNIYTGGNFQAQRRLSYTDSCAFVFKSVQRNGVIIPKWLVIYDGLTTRALCYNKGKYIYSCTNENTILKLDTTATIIKQTYISSNMTAIACDNNFNIYACGSTIDSLSAKGNVYSKTYKGLRDGYVMKFDSSNKLVWATFIGGSKVDILTSIKTDNIGNLYVGGYTTSSDMPFTSKAFDKSYSNNKDGIFFKMDSMGKNLKWLTYLGDTGYDYITSVAIGKDQKVYAGGYTNSTSGIASKNAEKTSLTGFENSILMSFDSSGKRIWGRYFGGSKLVYTGSSYIYDRISGLEIAPDPNGSIMIVGGTAKIDGVSTPGAIIEDYGAGARNGFMAKIDTAGLQTYGAYIADYNYHGISACAWDGNDFLVACNSNGGISPLNSKFTHGFGFNGFAFISFGYMQLYHGFEKTQHLIRGNYAQSCLGNVETYTNKTKSTATYKWLAVNGTISGNTTSDSVVVQWNKAPLGKLYFISTVSGVSDTTKLKINVDSACVWPGDANNDKIANNRDILTIGKFYTDTLQQRLNASLTWKAQIEPYYSLKYQYYKNFADCNGDGIVNSSDTNAVSINYSKTHLKTLVKNQGSITDPNFSIVLKNDTAKAGATISGDILLGSKTLNTKDIYGLAYTIQYPVDLVESISIDYSKSLFGKNPVYIQKQASSGLLETAICRTNGKDTTFGGILGTIKMTLKKVLPSKSNKLVLKIVENQQIDLGGLNVPLYLKDDSLISTYTGIENNQLNPQNISIYPNPAKDKIIIAFDQSLNGTLNIIDMEGRKVISSDINWNRKEFSTAGLTNGLYFIQVNTLDGYFKTQKLIISK